MKFWQKIPGKVKISLQGLNVEKFINYITNAGFFVLRAKRKEYNRFELVVYSKDSQKIIENAQKFGYKIEIKSVFGFYKIADFIFKRFALIVSLIFCLSVYLFSNLFVWSININGINNLSKGEIITYLKENNIGVGKVKTNINAEELEKNLLNHFKQISLVSVYLYGNSVNINISERLSQSYLDYSPILSEYDGVVKEFTLVSGTSNLKVGDIIRQGDILVLPYIIDNAGKKKSIKPQANIVVEVDFNETIIYNENREILEDTGVCTTSYNVSLFGLKFRKDKPCPYTNYRKETREYFVLNNLFLPVKKVETVYYEQNYVSRFIAFETVKGDLIKKAYENLNGKAKSFEILSKDHNIIKNGNEYYITATCKAVVCIGEKL